MRRLARTAFENQQGIIVTEKAAMMIVSSLSRMFLSTTVAKLSVYANNVFPVEKHKTIQSVLQTLQGLRAYLFIYPGRFQYLFNVIPHPHAG